ncbi:MAG: MmcQ/YjbR family DNA-binding protein [Clostridia bacterium]|nr:MmcQ/YjbR family DNA-binding protein [Clostridia bacterium]
MVKYTDRLKDWIDAYALQKPGVEKSYKAEWDMQLYRVGGKIFLEFGGDRQGVPIYTMKLEPAYSELLRAQYPGSVVPGYYANKLHWSSVYLDGAVPDETWKSMIDNAYALVFSSLSKKLRAALS